MQDEVLLWRLPNRALVRVARAGARRSRRCASHTQARAGARRRASRAQVRSPSARWGGPRREMGRPGRPYDVVELGRADLAPSERSPPRSEMGERGTLQLQLIPPLGCLPAKSSSFREFLLHDDFHSIIGNVLTEGFSCLFVFAFGVGCLDVLIKTIQGVFSLKPLFSHIFFI